MGASKKSHLTDIMGITSIKQDRMVCGISRARRRIALLLMTVVYVAVAAVPVVPAKQVIFDFLGVPAGAVPPGWVSATGGDSGLSGSWQVVNDSIPSLSSSLDAEGLTPRFVTAPVLAQTGRVTAQEHFPMLVYERGMCRDFTMSLKFKILQGNVDTMAGIVFRYVNPKNYYVIRASSKDRTLRFYKYFQGLRDDPIGPSLEIPLNTWIDLKVEGKGSEFQAWINGNKVFETPVVDYSFDKGLVGVWTKSDSVSHFGNIVLDYKPLKSMAEQLVEMAAARFEDLEEISILARKTKADPILVVASTDESQLGRLGEGVEKDVIENKNTYKARERDRMTTLTVPIEDHNGDAVGALRIIYKGFRGESSETSILRAKRVAAFMQDNLGVVGLFER